MNRLRQSGSYVIVRSVSICLKINVEGQTGHELPNDTFGLSNVRTKEVKQQ